MKTLYYAFFIMFFAWAVQADEIDTLVAKVKVDKIAVATAQQNYLASVKALNDYLINNNVPVVVPPVVVPVTKTVKVVVYGSDGCAPCKAMIPVIDALKKAGKDITYTLDAKGVDITATPTIILSVGGKEVSRAVGYLGVDSMTKWITETEVWANK